MQIERKIPIALERYLIDLAIVGLLAMLYLPLLWYWTDGWLNKSISIEHEYYSHGLIGLPFAAYLAWNQRKTWRSLPDPGRQNPAVLAGLAMLLLGGFLYLSRVPDYINLSFPLVLTGLCLWLKGWAGMRLLAFPLFLIWFATPTQIPYLLAPYTLPLQQFIAGVAGFILIQLGLDVTVNQIYLYVNGRIVEVAPFCAGLKMLFTTLYVAMMLLYWTGTLSSRTKTTLLLLGAIVLSVSGNIIRNTLLTYFHGTGKDGLFDLLHEGWGGDLYSAVMLLILIPLLNWIDDLPDFSTPSESESLGQE